MQTLSDLKFYRDTYQCRLSPKQRKLLVQMHQATQKGFPTPSEWIAVEYCMSQAMARVFVSRIRVKLRGTGWTIDTHEGGATSARAKYSVVPA